MTGVKLPITADHPSELEATAVPLCVDLDGTLLDTATLLEAVLQLLRRSLFHGLQLLAWLFRGLVFQFLGLSALGAYLAIYRQYQR